MHCNSIPPDGTFEEKLAMVELLHKHVEIYLEMKIVQEYETDFQGSYWEMAMIRSRDFLESKF